jgi:hypothetical protein
VHGVAATVTQSVNAMGKLIADLIVETSQNTSDNHCYGVGQPSEYRGEESRKQRRRVSSGLWARLFSKRRDAAVRPSIDLPRSMSMV